MIIAGRDGWGMLKGNGATEVEPRGSGWEIFMAIGDVWLLHTAVLESSEAFN